ncbi:DUF4198 domain-containing protein [Magnetococcales bacterium HHB-1]
MIKQKIRRLLMLTACITGISLTATPAWSHFLQLIPTSDRVNDTSLARQFSLELTFTHPMEGGPAMEMAKPVRFGVQSRGNTQDLIDRLTPRQVDKKQAWQASYPVTRPGNYLFFVEPTPYWEPGEGKMIIHYTKVVVDGFDWGEGWDQTLGLPVEIKPLVRPYSLWTGNLFRGLVLKDGKPVPHAEVEVEWVNDGSITPPSDAFVTQVIKADDRGIFSYAMPRAGWWGFAALIDGKHPMNNPEGKPVPVELGGLMWVHTVDMK